MSGDTPPPSDTDTLAVGSVPPSEERGLDATVAASPTRPSHPRGEHGSLGRGDRVGRYLVLDVLGRGGMGVVYTAYDPQLDRKIALKLRRPSEGDGDTGHLRLQREAQAIAQLSHPNVVAVHDVGTVGDRVFIAMELVEGQDLRQWLEAGSRSHAQIVACFVQAGRGLAAAHAEGLVHRDFKPDNVLVGNDGRARVVDFGLVRAARWTETSLHGEDTADLPLDESSREFASVELTTAGSLLGTPAYMSPEQWSGKPGQAQSDQFSFCVALYEALYGQRPFEGVTLATLSAAVLAGEVRAAKGSVPSRLRRILLRGLAVKPHERYPNMNGLLLALERAMAPRRVWKAAAGGAVVLGGAALAWTLRPEPPSCAPLVERATSAWTTARRDAMKSRFLAVERSFAADTWARVDREVGAYLGDWSAMQEQACEGALPTGAQQCLDDRLRSAAILLELLDDADLETVTRAVSLVRGLSDLDACGDAQRLQERLVPNDPALGERVATVRDELTRATMLLKYGRNDAAEAALDEAAALAVDVDYAPLAAEVAVLRGELTSSAGKVDEALKLYDHAFARALASRHDEVALRVCLALLFIHGVDRQERTEAERWAERARAMVERTGSDEERVLEVEGTWASAIAQTGDLEGARDLLSELVPVAEQAGREDVAAQLRNNLGSTYARLGQFDRALETLQESLDYTEGVFGPDHPQVLRSRGNLAVTMLMSGEAKKGAALLEEIIPRQEAALGPEHPDVANMVEALGVVYLQLDRFSESEAARRRVLRLREQQFGPTAVPVLLSHVKIAVLQLQSGRFEALATTVDEMLASLARREEPMPAGPRARILAVACDAALLRDGEQALELATELEALTRDPTGELSRERNKVPLWLGGAHLMLGHRAKAIEYLETIDEDDDLDTVDEIQARLDLGMALSADAATADRGRALVTDALAEAEGMGAKGRRLQERHRVLSALAQ